MKRCTAIARTACTGQAKRWASHDRASLAKEKIQGQVEASLGQDDQGRPLRVDDETKTIATADGDLPMSPLFDSAWIKSRRRQRKDDPTAPTGRFRKRLQKNPFARALATPLRQCSLTGAPMPRFFLQDLEIISHPETGQPWYAPGPLATDGVDPMAKQTTSFKEHRNNIEDEDGAQAEPQAESSEKGKDRNSSTKTLKNSERPRRAPITIYTLCRKSLLDRIKKKQAPALLGPRSGSSVSNDLRKAVWRDDLPDYILGTMRRTLVDTLISRAKPSQSHEGGSFIEPVSSWEAIQDVERRESVLWLPRSSTGNTEDGDMQRSTNARPPEYTTIDVDGAKYNHKMAVHNLPWILGEEELARLKQASPEVFGKHEILVLKSWRSHSMARLHMLLWRMQGFLSGPPEAG